MKPQKSPKKNSFNDYARFSGMVFQMIAIIVAGTFFGTKLDEHFPNKDNLFTIILALISVVVSVVIVIMNINTASKKP